MKKIEQVQFRAEPNQLEFVDEVAVETGEGRSVVLRLFILFFQILGLDETVGIVRKLLNRRKSN